MTLAECKIAELSWSCCTAASTCCGTDGHEASGTAVQRQSRRRARPSHRRAASRLRQPPALTTARSCHARPRAPSARRHEATPEERHGGRFSVRVPVEPVARGRTAAERWAAPARVAPASPGCSGQVRWPQLSPFGVVAWPAPPRRSASHPKHARASRGVLYSGTYAEPRATFVHRASRGYKLPLLDLQAKRRDDKSSRPYCRREQPPQQCSAIDRLLRHRRLPQRSRQATAV